MPPPPTKPVLKIVNLTEHPLAFNHGKLEQIQVDGYEGSFSSPKTATTVDTTLPRNRKVTVKSSEDSSAKELILKRRFRFGRGLPSWRGFQKGDEGLFRPYYLKASKDLRYLMVLPARNLASFMKDIPDNRHVSQIMFPGTHNTLAFYGWPFGQCQDPAYTLLKQLRSGIRALDVRLSAIGDKLIAYHGVMNQHALFTDIVQTMYEYLLSEEGKSECLVLSLKQENFKDVTWNVFSDMVRKEVYNHGGQSFTEKGSLGRVRSSRDMWWLENRVPSLGEARGKIILFSRFGGDGSGWDNGLEGIGVHPYTWPDSRREGFEWQCKETTVRTHDWYDISSFVNIPEKASLALSTLIANPSLAVNPNDTGTSLAIPPAIGSTSNPKPKPKPIWPFSLWGSKVDQATSTAPIPGPPPTLPLSFSSAYSFPLALPTTVALGVGLGDLGIEGVNARIGRWALEIAALRTNATQSFPDPKDMVDGSPAVQGSSRPRICGWLFMDFFHEPNGLASLLVEMNFV